MPTGKGIYDGADEPDGDDRASKVTSDGDADVSKATPDVFEADEQAEPTA